MKTLNTLIKYHKQQLDVLRRQMGSLESQKVQILAMVERIKAEMRREIELAQQTSEMGIFFGDYAKRIRAREADAHKEVKEIEVKMDILRELIRNAFAELKKFETARDNRKEEQRKKSNRHETDQLDEIASQRFEREREE